MEMAVFYLNIIGLAEDHNLLYLCSQYFVILLLKHVHDNQSS